MRVASPRFSAHQLRYDLFNRPTLPRREGVRSLSRTQETTMAESFKDKVEDAGHKIAEAATKVGHQVGEKVEEATDWAKEKAHQAGHRIDEATQKAGAKLESSTGVVG